MNLWDIIVTFYSIEFTIAGYTATFGELNIFLVLVLLLLKFVLSILRGD